MQTAVQAGGTLRHDHSATSRCDLTGGRGSPAGGTCCGGAGRGGTNRGGTCCGSTSHAASARCGRPHGCGPDSAHGRLLLLPAADGLLSPAVLSPTCCPQPCCPQYCCPSDSCGPWVSGISSDCIDCGVASGYYEQGTYVDPNAATVIPEGAIPQGPGFGPQTIPQGQGLTPQGVAPQAPITSGSGTRYPAPQPESGN